MYQRSLKGFLADRWPPRMRRPRTTCRKPTAADGDRAYHGQDGRVPLATPVLVAEFEFVEWTPEGDLRHAAFVTLRDEKSA